MDLLAINGPIFLVIGAGFAAVRAGYVPAVGLRVLGDFVIRVALPALILASFARTPLAQIIRPGYVAGYALGSLGTFALAILVGRQGFGLPLDRAAVLGLGMAASNSGFMGYPVAQGIFGAEPAGLFLAQCMIVENLLILPLGTSLQGGGGAWSTLRATVAGMIRNPIVIALAAGLVLSAARVRLPGEVLGALDLLRQVSAPLALFVLGGTLAALPLGGMLGPALGVTAGKLVLHPVLVFAAMTLVGADPGLRAAATLFAAMPMLTIFPLLAQRTGAAALAAAALVAATALSFLTLGLATRWLGLAG